MGIAMVSNKLSLEDMTARLEAEFKRLDGDKNYLWRWTQGGVIPVVVTEEVAAMLSYTFASGGWHEAEFLDRSMTVVHVRDWIGRFTS